MARNLLHYIKTKMKFFLFFITLLGIQVSKAETFTKILMPTQQIRLPISVDSNISVKGRAYVNIVDSGNYYSVFAKKSGVSFISDSKNTYTIIVYPLKLYNFATELNTVISEMRGPRLKFSKDNPIISGRILHILDLTKFSSIALKHNSNFLLEATLDQDVKQDFKDHLTQYQITNNLPQIEFIKQNNSYQIKVLGNLKLSETHKKYISSFGIPVSYNKSKLSVVPTIELQVYITELRKSGFYKFGIGWPSSYGTSILPTEFTNKLEVELNAMENAGHGSILAKPTLVCKSGGEASFFAGGEIPIPTGYYRRSVSWKPYGITLKFSPVANQTGEISIDIAAEISTIDSSQSVDGIPGMLKNEVKSKFNIKQSKTIALSGLLKASNGEALNSIPFIGKLPILGKLFSSSDYRNNKTKLVILVTPKLIDSI